MKTPLLFVKLPRHVVESLQTTPSEELQLVLGGKERITTGILHVGQARYDVRYSNERSSAPPLLFQGSSTTPDMGDGWAQWTQCGKLMGKLTMLNKAKQPTRTHISNTTASAVAASSDSHAKAAASVSRFPQSVAVSSAAKSTPQKKPGIFRQNREMLREKILHMLALAPIDEAQILESVKAPQNVAMDILASVGQKSNSIWSLKPENFRLVQIDSWQAYSKQDKLQVADNALRAFDELNLSAGDADRMRVEKLQRRLELGLDYSPDTKQEPNPAAEMPVKGASHLPTSSMKTTPPKKKPMRSVIAPTLNKPRHLDASKSHKRPHGLQSTGISAPPTAASSTFYSTNGPADVAPAETPNRDFANFSARADRAAPLLSGKSVEEASEDGVNNEAGDGSELGASQRWAMTSAPPTAVSTSFGNGNHAVKKHVQRLQNKHSRHTSVDYHPASDAETEYRRRSRGRKDYSPSGSPLKPISRSHSRSSRRSPPEFASGREGRGQHRPVRSQPLQLQSLASASMRSDDAETDAAVHRVQEKLAQKMNERRIPAAKLRSRSSSDPGRRSIFHRPRGPSLSPISDLPRSPSPAEEAKVEPADTIEDLDRLHSLLTSAYAEYSQLRLQIESHCMSFESLATELAEAQAACNEAMAERQKAEAEREEGEEIPDDSHAGSSLGFNAVTDKCASDGARLYWMETPNGAWLADGPDAIVGQDIDREGHPCRTQKLLPEEERVLKANQAIIDQYIEMGSEDVRRWVRRYLRLHAQIELMDHELTTAYQRIYNEISAQYESLRDELGDSDVDAALADANLSEIASKPQPQELNIDMYKDNVSTSLSGLATATSHS
ncbi:hypothetical protein IWW36_003310 [Coemansia brasiliensis]|uniref:RNA polymerase II elongation factor ELL N-terminal domain-containing protein n=1 Tax=Coemansia brasiliensis TaxID=2650707 RepID=A0A9W8LYP0_9FUNG|nr:hypothetical protein IWW36_003310 [Coemansia brasiliensis]